MTTIVVTGAVGRLGSALTARLRASGHDVHGIDLIGEGVTHLDVTDFAATTAFIRQVQPQLVLHPAAWTDVDGCAREPEKAIAINGFGAQHMALAAAQVGAAVLYVSSNEVFDGMTGGDYNEYDTTAPVNPYGYSKWVGERAVVGVNPKHYIVRTAWLFAHGGKNFLQSIFNAAQAGKRLRVVTDEVANPTYNEDLADAIVRLIDTGRYGIYHFVNEGAVSRYAFARAFLDLIGRQDVDIEPITSAEWQRASLPPRYAGLRNLAGRQIGITLRPWQEAMNAFARREGLLK